MSDTFLRYFIQASAPSRAPAIQPEIRIFLKQIKALQNPAKSLGNAP
jgi:hypothetical protein